MSEQFSRTELLLGKEAMEALKKARVAVFGIGGVGGYTVEALARSGIGTFDLIDNDRVCLSNLNRQIIATRRTIGQYKVDVMKERILDINPEAVVYTHRCFYLSGKKEDFCFSDYTYVVDAVDTVTAKIELVLQAQEAGVPIISCMGAGNKLDPVMFQVEDIYKTSMCPLAKVMRKELRARGVKKLKVVYSKEPAMTPAESFCEEEELCQKDMERTKNGKRTAPGSTAFVPSVAGLIMAGEVIKDIGGLYK